jgi:hypothetical protein
MVIKVCLEASITETVVTSILNQGFMTGFLNKCLCGKDLSLLHVTLLQKLIHDKNLKFDHDTFRGVW